MKNIKFGFKLSSSAIYPSSIARQKVPLALNIFHESTISALNSLIFGSEGIQNFMKIIQRF